MAYHLKKGQDLLSSSAEADVPGKYLGKLLSRDPLPEARGTCNATVLWH